LEIYLSTELLDISINRNNDKELLKTLTDKHVVGNIAHGQLLVLRKTGEFPFRRE
jgi:hypothetical protein